MRIKVMCILLLCGLLCKLSYVKMVDSVADVLCVTGVFLTCLERRSDGVTTQRDKGRAVGLYPILSTDQTDPIPIPIRLGSSGFAS